MSKTRKYTIDDPTDLFFSTPQPVEEVKEVKEVVEIREAVESISTKGKEKKKVQPIKKDLSNDFTCYKLSEVASISRLSARTIQTYVKEGVLPATMVGNKWLVSREDLQRLLNGELKRKISK